ncbi:COMM domain-containing protein 3 [Biomphalaria pfeifferi]|uniref:COMM domain-containing protein 3 n=1 Tax=Biomphalaria pfeifferi TaxID=112525 RepID=A0AAD8B350_BIOPF|nr:COMM domain-containing protein 3 [Biomphalaria pfeifferi]
MELSASVTENIIIAGDSAFIHDNSYGQLVSCACKGILFEENRNVIENNPAFKDIDKDVLKAAYSGIVTLVIEAAKHDSTAENLSTFLEDCKYTVDRISTFNKIFLSQKSHIQLLLGKVGSSFPHIVDVEWRLDYYIKSNNLEKIDSAVYLINLKTEEPDEQTIKDIQFSCTLEQLQDLVGKLKDATKCMEKIAQV